MFVERKRENGKLVELYESFWVKYIKKIWSVIKIITQKLFQGYQLLMLVKLFIIVVLFIIFVIDELFSLQLLG